jgi:hypothetical protein
MVEVSSLRIYRKHVTHVKFLACLVTTGSTAHLPCVGRYRAYAPMQPCARQRLVAVKKAALV